MFVLSVEWGAFLVESTPRRTSTLVSHFVDVSQSLFLSSVFPPHMQWLAFRSFIGSAVDLSHSVWPTPPHCVPLLGIASAPCLQSGNGLGWFALAGCVVPSCYFSCLQLFSQYLLLPFCISCVSSLSYVLANTPPPSLCPSSSFLVVFFLFWLVRCPTCQTLLSSILMQGWLWVALEVIVKKCSPHIPQQMFWTSVWGIAALGRFRIAVIGRTSSATRAQHFMLYSKMLWGGCVDAPSSVAFEV